VVKKGRGIFFLLTTNQNGGWIILRKDTLFGGGNTLNLATNPHVTKAGLFRQSGGERLAGYERKRCVSDQKIGQALRAGKGARWGGQHGSLHCKKASFVSCRGQGNRKPKVISDGGKGGKKAAARLHGERL